MTSVNSPKDLVLCRLFGHQWYAAHRLDLSPRGLKVWVYTDHVCIRCYKTEWRMPETGDRVLSSAALARTR